MLIDKKMYHHFYLNCNCVVASYLGGDVILGFSNLKTAVERSWKLKLRPLSDLKECEAVEAGLYSKRVQWHEIKWNEVSNNLKNISDLNIDIEYSPKQFQYLLSRHFDVFGLIEKGLAIKKT